MGRKKSKKQTAASRRSSSSAAAPPPAAAPATVETETYTENSMQDVNDDTSNNDRNSSSGNNDKNNVDRISVRVSVTEQHQIQSQSQTNSPLVNETPSSQNKQQQEYGHSPLVSSEEVDPTGPGGRHVHHDEQPDPEDIGLLTSKRKSRRSQLKSGYYYDNASQRHLTSSSLAGHHHHTYVSRTEWQRPYWLGSTLFLILLAFWLLDSLKDPLFARLVDGKISQHQPTAKLVSVACTLVLVCGLEYLQNLRQQHEQQQQQQQLTTTTTSSETTPPVLDDGGIWKRMPMMIGRLVSGRQRHGAKTDKRWRQLDDSPGQPPPPPPPPQHALDDVVSVGIFFQIGTPYVVVFSIIGYLIWKFEQQEQQQQQEQLDPSSTSSSSFQSSDHGPTSSQSWNWWYVLGYALYVSVESFGSLAVATFWSYTNSTLALDDAERYYGPIIATAQLGAIAGSTLVASGRWNAPVLFAVVSMTIVLQLIVIRLYDRKFPPTSLLSGGGTVGASTVASASITDRTMVDETQTVLTWQDNNATITKPFWSGLYLIIRHSYVLLILGVSCLYEVSMTLLDYQMKLLGFARFDSSSSSSTDSGISISNENSDNGAAATISFSEFMGRYGQVVNFTSLIFSSLLFPWLIRRYGLRRTLMIFPTFLLLVTVLAYGAVPGNLAVLFFSLSLLKAMTYSIHDPSKELLYIPTSNAVKFRAKFWIDVVGERISKAIGSAFNTLADDVDQSVKIGSIPSVVSSLGLWVVCYYVGKRFDKLLATGKIVGLENGIDPSTYSRVPRTEEQGGDGTGGGSYDVHDGDNDDDDDGDNNYRYRTTTSEPTELELMFEEQSHVSTLDLMADPVNDAVAANRSSSSNSRTTQVARDRGTIELPRLI